MVKPSLKTTSFKHHPMYLQKSMHVDYPFYGPKLQYQRAEVITGGDCNTVTNVWAAAEADWLVTQSGDPRVGTNSLLMTQTGAAADSSIYLLLDGPIDLSWANYVGFWYKGKNGVTYVANDIYLYIFTASGNYAYANAARYVSAMAYTETTPAVWHYAEIDIGDFIINSGYGTDKLEKVWGIGFCSHNLASTVTMNVDQIEFYTVGTGLGPARGLIMSAPLLDDEYAVRGYGLRWDEYSGRIDVSNADDYAFAGICTGNPSRTRLEVDATGGGVGVGDTTLYLVDPSLFESGKAQITDSLTSEEVTITAVNIVTRTITVSQGIANSYTRARNAYICMQGNEEGTVRVDFMVDGVVNLEAAQAVLLGYGCTCAALGNAPLTVNQAAAGEEGQIIGKTVTAATGDGDVFPVILTTCAVAYAHTSAELLGRFVVGQGSAELLGKASITP